MLDQVARIAGPELATLVSRYLLIDGLATQARFMAAGLLGTVLAGGARFRLS